MISSLRGMRDLVEDDAKRFLYCIKVCEEIAQRYDFSFIQTPLLEESLLFKRSVGQSSDIVGKEMYDFCDKSGNEISLRPEGTAGVVRAFIQKKYDKVGGVKKFYYHGAMFRYERPQKGRFRQFHQFGVECFGEQSAYEDINIIIMLKQILDTLGIKTKILINSLGCPKCMPPYKETLVKFLQNLDLCEDCQRRILTNPIRVLDCKNSSCQAKLKDAPKITHNLCKNCHDDFLIVQKGLRDNNIDFIIDTNLVRGLDYYSKTAFEFVSDEIGSQGSIAGGGRYDKLVEILGGKDTFGIGFAIGVDRLLELIKMPEDEKQGYYLSALCDEALEKIIEISVKLRKTKKVKLSYEIKSLKAHLKKADKQNALWFGCIGDDELKKEVIWLKNLVTKEEKQISLKDFCE